MLRSDPTTRAPRRTAYVVKVYPRFSETFIVTEILAREAAGEQLTVFALRNTTDTRFHPEIARVQAPVHVLTRPHRPTDAWRVFERATETVPGFADRFAALLPELVRCDASEVHQAITLACEVVDHGITHLHAHFASLSGRTAELAAQLAGIAFSVTAHAKDLFHESVDPSRLHRMIARSHHFITISAFNCAHLRREHPEVAQKVELVYNGLELDRFPYREPAAAELSDRPVRIAAVGRLVEKKGFPDLIEAVRRLRDGGLPVEARVAGGGELLEELQDRVEAAGLQDCFTLLGPRTQAEVRALLDWADVFAAPSVVGADGNADGLPTVLLEAMATGVPCVASTVTGIPEAIIDGVTGRLHAPGDVDGLVEALTALARAPQERIALATAARALIEQRFDSRRQARILRALEDGSAPAADFTPEASSAPEETAVPDLAGRRVAYVCVDPGVPVHGTKGASVHVQEVVRALVARGAHVTVFAARMGDDLPADLVDVDWVHVPVRARDAAEREQAQHRVAVDIAGRVAAAGFDLVYERCSLFSTVLARVAAHGIPGILEVNAPLIEEQRTHRTLIDEPLARRNLEAQMQAAVRTIAVSRPVAAWVRALVPGAPVRVIPNGVDVDRIVPGRRDESGRRPRVAFVGTLKPWHGVEALVQAAALAREDWELLIVGDGPQGEDLRRAATATGLDDRVTFTGAVAPDAVGPLLRTCDLAAAPYPDVPEDESYFSPLKVFEYLAAGLPVVASSVGQLPELLAGTDAGLLVAPSDPQALARALDGLAADRERRERMAAAARTRAVARHSWTSVVDRTLAGLALEPAPAKVRA